MVVVISTRPPTTGWADLKLLTQLLPELNPTQSNYVFSDMKYVQCLAGKTFILFFWAGETYFVCAEGAKSCFQYTFLYHLQRTTLI